MAGFADIQLEPETAQKLALGDAIAQGEVYRCVAPPVMGLAVRMLQDRAAAQEVVQDTFVQLMEHGSEVREPKALIGWIRKVAVNLCLMRLRSPWHSRRLQDDGRADGSGGWLEQDDEAAASGTMEASPDIERALARLNPETRFVVWLHDVEGYTHREIGELMGKTTSFSKSQLARGYEKLAEWYQPAEPGMSRPATAE
ncbi:MAG: sigma-70 family RNA polymerase sigma factor [Pseudomonadota bacterium]